MSYPRDGRDPPPAQDTRAKVQPRVSATLGVAGGCMSYGRNTVPGKRNTASGRRKAGSSGGCNAPGFEEWLWG
ncbi:hypothetical protein, partial [Prauserella alba]|uniref:hypothetical protein n=1 Tax=Prauserella alba TaxID=176898 RepID=UPI0031D48623